MMTATWPGWSRQPHPRPDTLGGSGLAQLDNLVARDVHAVVAGSGLIRVTATASLNAAVTASGAIIYSGNPQVTSSVTGSGTVTGG